jgi:hypothetical protein
MAYNYYNWYPSLPSIAPARMAFFLWLSVRSGISHEMETRGGDVPLGVAAASSGEPTARIHLPTPVLAIAQEIGHGERHTPRSRDRAGFHPVFRSGVFGRHGTFWTQILELLGLEIQGHLPVFSGEFSR